MAERRMFSKAVVESSRFMKLSVQARLLYFDLGMDADDEGFADSFMTLRRTQAKQRYLQELENQAFIKVMNEDNIIRITDWSLNNQIRKDRKNPSRYSHLLEDGQPNVNHMTA